jgi:hypothetical protein
MAAAVASDSIFAVRAKKFLVTSFSSTGKAWASRRPRARASR